MNQTPHYMAAMSDPTPYAGTVDEDQVSALITEFGKLVEGAGEAGFVLTYHAVDGVNVSGRTNLAGSGITQEQLGILLARALEHNAEHGCTS